MVINGAASEYDFPSTQTEEKKGYWITDHTGNDYCNRCGTYGCLTVTCPFCGAHMTNGVHHKD